MKQFTMIVLLMATFFTASQQAQAQEGHTYMFTQLEARTPTLKVGELATYNVILMIQTRQPLTGVKFTARVSEGLELTSFTGQGASINSPVRGCTTEGKIMTCDWGESHGTIDPVMLTLTARAVGSGYQNLIVSLTANGLDASNGNTSASIVAVDIPPKSRKRARFF